MWDQSGENELQDKMTGYCTKCWDCHNPSAEYSGLDGYLFEQINAYFSHNSVIKLLCTVSVLYNCCW